MGLSKKKYIDTKADHFNSYSVFIPLILGLSKSIDFWQNVEKNLLEKSLMILENNKKHYLK